GRAVGEDGGGGDEKISQAVNEEVWIDDAGVRIDAHRGAAHRVARVVESRDGGVALACEERWVPGQVIEGEVRAQVLREGAERGALGGIDAPVEDGFEVRRDG